jgi:hypothetical protein
MKAASVATLLGRRLRKRTGNGSRGFCKRSRSLFAVALGHPRQRAPEQTSPPSLVHTTKDAHCLGNREPPLNFGGYHRSSSEPRGVAGTPSHRLPRGRPRNRGTSCFRPVTLPPSAAQEPSQSRQGCPRSRLHRTGLEVPTARRTRSGVSADFMPPLSRGSPGLNPEDVRKVAHGFRRVRRRERSMTVSVVTTELRAS